MSERSSVGPRQREPVQELPPFGKRLFGFLMSLLSLIGLGFYAMVEAGSFGEAWRSGTTPRLWWKVIFLVLLGIGFGYGTYASFRSLIGKPLPKRALTGRSFGERASLFLTFGAILFGVGMMIFAIARMQNTGLPRSLGEGFVFVFGMLFSLGMFLWLAWVVGFLTYWSFKPAAKVSDLRKELGAPSYSDDSLVCAKVFGGRISAVIVDDKAGLIHFRRTFWPAGFWTIWYVPWFSCQLKKIKSVRQLIYERNTTVITTLIIVTPAGKGYIDSQASSFEELQRRFSSFRS
jgi:hypothetical protein